MKPPAPRAIALLLCLLGCGGRGGAPAGGDDQTLLDTGAAALPPGEPEVSLDADGDGFGPDDDCDDADEHANPDADEVCNGQDDDCNGWIDDADLGLADGQAYYRDGDGDGYGADGSPLVRCQPPAGFAWRAGDCDDADPAVFPGADEVCDDGRERDCDGLLDCEDGDCVSGPGGVPLAGCGEICGDNVDNDADDLADCADDECFAGLECADAYRVPPLEGAARAYEEQLSALDGSFDGYDSLAVSPSTAAGADYGSTMYADLWRLGAYPLYPSFAAE